MIVHYCLIALITNVNVILQFRMNFVVKVSLFYFKVKFTKILNKFFFILFFLIEKYIFHEFDCLSSNLGHRQFVNVISCINACKNNPECSGFVIATVNFNRICYFKRECTLLITKGKDISSVLVDGTS